MSVKKEPDGRWLCQVRPHGAKGLRFRKKFTTKGEAIEYEQYILAQHKDTQWIEKRDNRRLSELVKLWFNAHGTTLKDGETRKSVMLFICDYLGEPKATDFTAKDFANYREKRLSGELFRTKRVQTVAPRTLNLEQVYITAMFNELIRLGEWTLSNPLENIRQFKTTESEMAFLTLEQIPVLLDACRKSKVPELVLVTMICLATGARWSEAEQLTNNQISNLQITYSKTKGGRNRTVPISKNLFELLPEKKGRIFPNCYSAFLSALKRSGIELPDRQKSHVLRHTFASHFMMNGGNILVLQRILGHTDIKMTMRYAHFSPNHFNEALDLNPLNSFL